MPARSGSRAVRAVTPRGGQHVERRRAFPYGSEVHDERVARSIVPRSVRPGDGARLTPIGDGFASDAWLVATPDRDGGTAVLRVANGRGLAEVTYEMEHVLKGRLHAAGASVPRPIIGFVAGPRPGRAGDSR